MKLKVKKEYFDLVKSGEKNIEFRDAHLTLICEETGRICRRKVLDVTYTTKERTRDYLRTFDIPDEEIDNLFEDDHQVAFILK